MTTDATRANATALPEISRRRILAGAAVIPACGLAAIVPVSATASVSSANLSDLFRRFTELRDLYFAQIDGFAADAVGEVWIPMFYEILDFPAVTLEDTVAKARFLLGAIERKEMHLFEEDGVNFIRSIAATPLQAHAG
jgi:hypothetical protein